MPTTMPANAQDRETPDDVGILRIYEDREGEHPEVRVCVGPRKAVLNDDGTPKLNAYDKVIHRLARGWQAWWIVLGQGCEGRIKALLTDSTMAVLNGAGSVDIDAAREQIGIELENERQAGTLPAAARIEGTPPEDQ